MAADSLIGNVEVLLGAKWDDVVGGKGGGNSAMMRGVYGGV